MDSSLLDFHTDIWYRRSTCEESYPSGWVLDFTIKYGDVIHSTTRFTGKSELDVLEDMRNNIQEVINEVIIAVEIVLQLKSKKILEYPIKKSL
jgi:hypothetical protein